MMVNNNTTIRRDEEEREREREREKERDCATSIWSMHSLSLSYFFYRALFLFLSFTCCVLATPTFFFQRKNDIGSLHRMQKVVTREASKH